MSSPENCKLLQCDSVELRAGYRTLIRNFSLELSAHESIAVTGPNGFGKTTLLRALCGISRPYRGRVYLNGQMLWPDRDGVLKNDVCFFASQPALFLDHSVISNLKFYMRSIGRRFTDEELKEALDSVDLGGHAQQTSRTLSTGQKRRLTLAFLNLARPSLVFLDEPTNGLDVQGVKICLEFLERSRAAGAGLLIATHDQALTAWCQTRIDLKELAQ